MTREEEEIRKAAYNLYPHPQADSSRIGFMLGAEWADNHPIKYKKPKITQKMITNREIYLEAVSQLTSISSNDIMSKKKVYREIDILAKNVSFKGKTANRAKRLYHKIVKDGGIVDSAVRKIVNK